MSEEQFWRFTPSLFRLWVGSRLKALSNARRDMRWSVWHTAVLSRAEKIPTLEEFLDGAPKPVERQTPEQIEATFRAMFGAPPEDT